MTISCTSNRSLKSSVALIFLYIIPDLVIRVVTLEWELDKKTYETNVKGFIEIVHYAFNYFVKQGHGHVAATSSLASIRGNSWAPAYSASKAFMSVYMEGLHMKAKKWARKNKSQQTIFITDIQPGFVNTKLAKGKRSILGCPGGKGWQTNFPGD